MAALQLALKASHTAETEHGDLGDLADLAAQDPRAHHGLAALAAEPVDLQHATRIARFRVIGSGNKHVVTALLAAESDLEDGHFAIHELLGLARRVGHLLVVLRGSHPPV